jgi:biotin transport system substrate-specific component
MAGVVLGAKRGAIAVLIVLVLVAIGLPVLSGGRGGLAAFVGPTAGFLVGWVAAAYVTGYLSERLVDTGQSALVQTVGFFLAAMIGGIVVLYACGIAYLAVAAKIGLSQAFVGSMAFIPGDVIKAFVAALVGRAVMVGYPLLPAKV